MQGEYDHRLCPQCERPMRLICVEPRRLDRDESFEIHIYHCEICEITSRFVFEMPSRATL